MSKKALNFNYLINLVEKCRKQISDGFQEVNACYWELISKRDNKNVIFFLLVSNSAKKGD